jgi:ABC-type transport system involved in multi-copper enzyme maturation permease subunit
MRPIRAEFAKLTRPLTAAVLVFVVALATMALIQEQAQGRTALATVKLQKQYSATLTAGDVGYSDSPGRMVMCSRRPGSAQSSECAQYLAGLDDTQNAELKKQIETVQAASLEQNPLGVGTQAGGLLASLLGFFAIVLLAAAHVGGEWTGKTVRAVLTRQPHRLKFLAVKTLSVWLASLGLLAATWAILAVGAAYFRLASPLDPVAGGLPAVDGLIALGKSAAVLAVYSVLATGLAVIFRGVIGGIVAGAGFGVASLMLGYYYPWAAHHEFVYWVTGYMGFDTVPMIGTGTYWLATFWGTVQRPTFAGGLAGLGILLVLAAVAVALPFRRADITV